MLKHRPEGADIVVAGVDAGGDSRRRIGKWETHDLGGGPFRFMPVARLDPADQSRRIPHSLRIAVGLRALLLPRVRADLVQAHRADLALAARRFGKRLAYFIHTQEQGLSRGATDSIWRHAGGVHERIERSIVRNADISIVFNLDYATTLQRGSDNVHFSPTWYDEDLFYPAGDLPQEPRLVWLGRLEPPKDPGLVVRAFAEHQRTNAHSGGTLKVIGDGTLLGECEALRASLPADISARIEFCGRLSPAEVAATMREGSVFVMTSQPGYEGYPRALVEALATGLPAAVTPGSDTGGLVVDGITGFTSSNRSPQAVATAIERALALRDWRTISDSVARLTAAAIAATLFELTTTGAGGTT